MTDNPMRYEWTGTTVEEADNLLDAAQDLISGHLKALAPGDALTRHRIARTARLGIRISLDLTELTTSVSEVQALNAAVNPPDC